MRKFCQLTPRCLIRTEIGDHGLWPVNTENWDKAWSTLSPLRNVVSRISGSVGSELNRAGKTKIILTNTTSCIAVICKAGDHNF